jgi:hypothetical protein
MSPARLAIKGASMYQPGINRTLATVAQVWLNRVAIIRTVVEGASAPAVLGVIQ